jgi:hypothetical protein
MAANANDYSLAGAINHGFNAAFGTTSLAFQNNFVVQAVLGNPITTIAYGSLTDVAGAAASEAPAFIEKGMGTAITYGRRTTAIEADIARVQEWLGTLTSPPPVSTTGKSKPEDRPTFHPLLTYADARWEDQEAWQPS